MLNIEETKCGNFFFIFVVGLTTTIILSGSYLPLIDLPQHAAQVATLDDLLKGQSIWSGLVELNFNTPYLIGYLSWLGLMQFSDIVVSSRILVALIFLLFIFSSILLKNTLHTSWLVPWIAIPSFFGFCYEWGFLTYLLAISIGIIFFVQNIKWSKKPNLKQCIMVIILGVLLFYSHILSYLFFCLLSFVFVFYNLESKKNILKILPIYFIFFCLIIFYLKQGDSLSAQYTYGVKVMYHSIGEKIMYLFIYPWSMLNKSLMYISLILLCIPLLMGYVFSKKIEKYIPLVVFIFIWFALPHFMSNTYFIYERYSILFFIFYFSVFEKQHNFQYSRYASYIFLVLINYLMLEDYKNIFLAKKETSDFATIVEKLPDNQRVLGLMFEPSSMSVSTPFTYVHFGSWYQAQKNGWSDFNFAWFHPQIVRYKPDTVPEVKPGFEWAPQNVQLLKNCQNYNLLIIRAYDQSVKNIVQNSLCHDYTLMLNEGTWFVFSKITNS
ncbi:hypothetical protein [Acinetobacter defluvii]|uniref:hypothetical protein n=1 Tax=Acinetobacter defluvii TaxID=1871111 RepID=UPI003AF6ACEC